MNENTRQDIRKLLKQFGIQSDEAIIAHLEKNANGPNLALRLTLEDVTESDEESDTMMPLVVSGTVRR